MRIAIVGSGLSGLVAAHRLHRNHDIAVFEADPQVGGQPRTVELESKGQHFAIDTGLLAFSEQTHPHFSRLLRELDVFTQPTEMSIGLSCEQSGLEWSSRSLRSVFSQPANLVSRSFLRMLSDVRRFNRESRSLLDTPAEKVALGDYLCGAGYSSELVHHYLVPIGATIWSAGAADFLRFPAASFVRFLAEHGLLGAGPKLPWRVIQGGSQRYVEALAETFADQVRTRTPVLAIRRHRRFVEIATPDGTERFDRVVLAVHSDQALRMLVDPSGFERTLLRAIDYQENEVVLHTDVSLMPRTQAAWAGSNYRIPRSPRERVLVTHDMNRLQRIEGPVRFLVTLNGADLIDPRRVLRRFSTRHPVFDGEAITAQRKRGEISGSRRTHYCGAYWGHGLQEDGVRSALAVCDEIDALGDAS